MTIREAMGELSQKFHADNLFLDKSLNCGENTSLPQLKAQEDYILFVFDEIINRAFLDENMSGLFCVLPRPFPTLEKGKRLMCLDISTLYENPFIICLILYSKKIFQFIRLPICCFQIGRRPYGPKQTYCRVITDIEVLENEFTDMDCADLFLHVNAELWKNILDMARSLSAVNSFLENHYPNENQDLCTDINKLICPRTDKLLCGANLELLLTDPYFRESFIDAVETNYSKCISIISRAAKFGGKIT